MALRTGALAVLDKSCGVSDACLLDQVTEDAFVENIRLRFEGDRIYTYIGNVVVSINPYKKLPLYIRDVILEYRSRNIYELPPHLYAIADDAYRSMRDKNLDQCVIISGESGSGKTEASKVIMQYVAAVSGKGQDIDRVKEQLLKSNPVLEAFGNAKTLRNDNSSRFGKYMDIEFDFKGDPIGGVISNYLLEKSRVVRQNIGERNFHIFYQLLNGAETSLLKSLKLNRNFEHYEFLKHSGCALVESIDDKQDYITTKDAMEVIGFSLEEIIAVFQIVSTVLKLGNVQFQHYSNIDGTDGCRLLNENEVYEVCQLLHCKPELLLSALMQRTMETSSDRVTTDLSAMEGSYARDALCKALYSRMFSWLILRINDSIKVRTQGRPKSMGVLDIYGFEIFEHNSFEQFFINYCNEKLQQIFIELTLKEEQEEYIREGIEWIHVDYFNNAVICELIEKTNTGILAMLDEECLRPGDVSDETFLNKLTQMCASHEHFESRSCKKSQSDRTLPHDAFRLKHYAGAVIYKVEGFLDKNNDLLYRDLTQTMYKCQHSLLKLLFPEGNPERTSLRRPATAGSQFKASIAELMKNLLTKSPNYIRCIKPNDHKQPHIFHEELVRHQVRYLGLMENVRVRRAGYAFRQMYEQFLYRYKMLSLSTWPRWQDKADKGVKEILTAQGVSMEEVAFGKNKIFIKNPRTLFMLEDRRRDKMHDLATLVQKMFRGWWTKRWYQRLKLSQLIISSHWRGYKAKRDYQRLRSAAITICAFARGWKARCILAEMKYHKQCVWAVSIIRKFYLGWKVRKEYRKCFRAIAGPRIVRFLRTCLKRRFLVMLGENLPSMSPADHYWPPCSTMFRRTSEEIRRIFHRWRCEKYRERFDQPMRCRMREKVVASDIFRDRKANYPRSVGHPFRGDYVRIRQNQKWKKVSCETNDQHVVFADIVMKINRKNGKMVPQLLVVSTNAILVLDQRTLVIKYRIPVAEVERMSLSPFPDRIVIIHLRKEPFHGTTTTHYNPQLNVDEHENGDILTKKGDFLLSSDHVIEIVAKLFLVVQNMVGKGPDVNIRTQFQAEFGGQKVDIQFKMGIPDVPPGTVKIQRKSNKLEILEP